MKAIKGNKVYIVDEKTKASYVKSGFDIINDNNEIIEYGSGKKVDASKYAKLKAENKALKEKCTILEIENKNYKLNTMTVEQLKAYAAENGIDLGDATTKEAIIAKLGE